MVLVKMQDVSSNPVWIDRFGTDAEVKSWSVPEVSLIDTPMSESAFSAQDIARMVPMKRAGTPGEVSDLIGFLASTQAAYITGQIISINDGII